MTKAEYEKLRKAKSEARRFKRKYLAEWKKLEAIKAKLQQAIKDAMSYPDDDQMAEGYQDGLLRCEEIIEEVEG